jgi:hypothetical protein
MSDLFEQTVQVLVSLAMSADAETLDDATLNREVDALVDAYLVWTPTRRPAGFRPRGYNERDELAQAFWEKVPPKPIDTGIEPKRDRHGPHKEPAVAGPLVVLRHGRKHQFAAVVLPSRFLSMSIKPRATIDASDTSDLRCAETLRFSSAIAWLLATVRPSATVATSLSASTLSACELHCQ